MSLDLQFEEDETNLIEEEIETSRTYAIDWETGRIIGMIDGMEAINQYIKKALLTPRYRCLIYDDYYGSEIKEALMDNDVTPEYIDAEMPFLIEDAIVYDERISQVTEIEAEFPEEKSSRDNAIVHASVDTIFGVTEISEVI